MQSRIFRKTSMERISSPEQLQDYMRVTSPGIWMVLAAVIALLAGLIVSSALATLESSVTGTAVVETAGSVATIALPQGQEELVKPGMAVRVGEQDAHVTLVYRAADGARAQAELDGEGAGLPEGTYEARIITETVRPISFLLNSKSTDE